MFNDAYMDNAIYVCSITAPYYIVEILHSNKFVLHGINEVN
jgi:hypothetical protein